MSISNKSANLIWGLRLEQLCYKQWLSECLCSTNSFETFFLFNKF